MHADGMIMPVLDQFSTPNTVFPGMPVANYEYMLAVFQEYNRRTE